MRSKPGTTVVVGAPTNDAYYGDIRNAPINCRRIKERPLNNYYRGRMLRAKVCVPGDVYVVRNDRSAR